MSTSIRVHRALADSTRARLVERLRHTDGDLAASELADELGLHPNTVRAHLDVLEKAGLVQSRVEHRHRPGRPRRLFAAVRDPAETEHALLAAALAGALEPIDEGVALAEAAGRGWGHRLVANLAAGPVEEPVARLVGMLEARGFEPQRSPDGVTMGRCPFRELAEEHPRVVCGFHAGLLTGALEELHASCELVELRPWVANDRCVASLRSL